MRGLFLRAPVGGCHWTIHLNLFFTQHRKLKPWLTEPEVKLWAAVKEVPSHTNSEFVYVDFLVNKSLVFLISHCPPPTVDDTLEYAWSNYWAKQDWSDHSNENAAAPRVATIHELTYSWISYLWRGCRGKQISEMSSNLRHEDCNRLFISTLLTPDSEETPCYLSIYLIFGFLLHEGRGYFEWSENEIHY